MTVPAFGAAVSAMVSGTRSPYSSMRKMMNCPGLAFLAMSGASIFIRVTCSLRSFLYAIRYMESASFLSGGPESFLMNLRPAGMRQSLDKAMKFIISYLSNHCKAADP